MRSCVAAEDTVSSAASRCGSYPSRSCGSTSSPSSPTTSRARLRVSIVARAIEAGALEVDLIDLREHGLGNHRQVDDAPFGGGAGMVMMIEPLAAALEPLAGTHRVLFTPAGRPMTQSTLDDWATTRGGHFRLRPIRRGRPASGRPPDRRGGLLGRLRPCRGRGRRGRRNRGDRPAPPRAWWATRTRQRPSRFATVCSRSRCTPGPPTSRVGRCPRCCSRVTTAEVEEWRSGAATGADQGSPARPAGGWRQIRDLIQFRAGRDYQTLSDRF